MIDNLSYSSTKFITGIRAYAAFGVFLIHSGGFGLRKFSIYSDRLIDFGKYGVVAFFVISAFTICMSIEREKEFSFKKYILKRFLRVAPMYYLALFVAFWLGGCEYYAQLFNVNNDIYSLVYHMSFLNWFSPSHQNNFIGVEWSVPIEFSYYLIIPFLLVFLKKNQKIIIWLLIISGLVSLSGYLYYTKLSSIMFFNWSLIKYFFSFIFGIFIYIVFISTDFIKKEFLNLSLLISLFGFLMFIILGFEYKDFIVTIFIGMIILICKTKSTVSMILFENRIIQYLGTISYSIYLTHFIFFYHLSQYFTLFKNPYIVFTVTIITSSFTYFLVEKPFVDLGKRIIK